MPQEFKYLAIKNWEVYQPQNVRSFPWIRDYKDKEFDPDFNRLTILQRYMLDACCRLRGRHGKNLENDPLWICRATAVLPRERHNATTAIQQLIDRGFLILTNDEHSPLEERRGDNKRGDRTPEKQAPEKPPQKPSKPEQESTETSSVQAVIYLPLNSGKEFPITDKQFARWKHLYPAVDVMQQLRAMVGWLDSHPTRKKTNKGIRAFANGWLQRAQDNPSGAAKYSGGVNGNGTRSVSKADAREKRIIENVLAYRTATSGATHDPRNGAMAVPGDGETGVCGLDGEPEIIPPGKDPCRTEPANERTTKT